MIKTAGIWFVYEIAPIDIDWEHLAKVQIAEVPSEARDAATELGWEGDVRDDECVKFFVPDETQWSEGYAWKQDNNGTTYVASPVELPHLDAVSL